MNPTANPPPPAGRPKFRAPPREEQGTGNRKIIILAFTGIIFLALFFMAVGGRG